ncbi:DUF4360 domain-containing protein [Halobacteriovorax sp. HLS]|uniref:DUF4360 domain-containing protein n=1 Tax=Halobacteriovorax sp. HLS TaxID=2234000 RepID=UPI000FD98F5A|nr:DUF4360 domain-containing protein [Halobacteriovorax sp. HLS]
MKLTKNTIILAALFSSTLANARSLEFKEVQLSGTGCKEGTTSTIVSDDGNSLSVLFDELMVQIPQFSADNDNDEISDDNEELTSKYDKSVDRKVCLMNIAAKVPRGFKISNIELSFDYRGASFTDAGTTTSFKTKLVNFQGPSGRHQYPEKLLGTKRFRANEDTDFVLSQTRTLPIESSCSTDGQNVSRFALKNILVAKTIRSSSHFSPEAFLAVDSADMQAKVKFKLDLQRCGDTGDLDDRDDRSGRGDNSRITYQRQRCERLGGRWDHRMDVCFGLRQGRGSSRSRR